MSLTHSHNCVLLTKSSSTYCIEYVCGDFARRPYSVKDLGQFPQILLQNPGLIYLNNKESSGFWQSLRKDRQSLRQFHPDSFLKEAGS